MLIIAAPATLLFAVTHAPLRDMHERSLKDYLHRIHNQSQIEHFEARGDVKDDMI
jgi:hypothetical protein